MLAKLFMIVPPVPITSKLKTPPSNTNALLIIIFPPVLGDTPKVPEVSVNEVALFNLIVKKSADRMLPGVVYISGTAPVSVSTLLALAANVTALLPDAIWIAPIVCVGVFVTAISDATLNASTSLVDGEDREGDQFAATV